MLNNTSMRSTKPATSPSKHLTSQLAALHWGLSFPFNDAIGSWTMVCKTRVTRVTKRMQIKEAGFFAMESHALSSLWCSLRLSHSRTCSEIHAAPNVCRRVIHESSRSWSGFILSLVLGPVVLRPPSKLNPDDLRHLAGALEIPCTSMHLYSYALGATVQGSRRCCSYKQFLTFL